MPPEGGIPPVKATTRHHRLVRMHKVWRPVRPTSPVVMATVTMPKSKTRIFVPATALIPPLPVVIGVAMTSAMRSKSTMAAVLRTARSRSRGFRTPPRTGSLVG
jgi:hypothetical protein